MHCRKRFLLFVLNLCSLKLLLHPKEQSSLYLQSFHQTKELSKSKPEISVFSCTWKLTGCSSREQPVLLSSSFLKLCSGSPCTTQQWTRVSGTITLCVWAPCKRQDQATEFCTACSCWAAFTRNKLLWYTRGDNSVGIHSKEAKGTADPPSLVPGSFLQIMILFIQVQRQLKIVA